ncbi:MAG: hypothetical protein EON85_13975 [Brevundimonas sp.]|nr:MAG: hypothetical protein EON85_13975 [Brevundimonas sp.]
MPRLRLISSIVAVFALVAGPAVAQDLSAADRTAIEARVAHLEQIVGGGDLAGALETVPPRIFRTIAARAGATEEQLMSAMREMIRTQLSGVTVLGYDMDLAAAPPLLTPDGSRTYLLIPTTTTMQTPAARVRTRNQTLALKEDGVWYMIRIDDQNQISMIRDLWPEFAAVDFPTGTMEAAD